MGECTKRIDTGDGAVNLLGAVVRRAQQDAVLANAKTELTAAVAHCDDLRSEQARLQNELTMAEATSGPGFWLFAVRVLGGG